MESAGSVAVAASLTIQSKLAKVHPVRVTLVQALKIALCCGCSSRDDLIDFIGSRHQSRALKSAGIGAFLLNEQEVCGICTELMQKAPTQALLDAINTPSFLNFQQRVELALTHTIAERTGRDAWKMPIVKALTVFLLHRDAQPHAPLGVVFGSIVRTDVRRLEDLHFQITQAPMQIIPLCELTDQLSNVVLS